jgi:thioredoxin reductase/SAM-dependent methyltransferase
MTEHNSDSGHAAVPILIRHCDVAVIGGSAAGLAAALQLTRQQRSVLVVDDDSPRNASASHMHGYLGREGTPPEQIRVIGRSEVRSYGGEILRGRVLGVQREDDMFHLKLSGGHGLIARRVIAASGIVDELPDIPGLAERWGDRVIHCPFCHGFEVRDQRVVQIITTPVGLHPTSLMRHLTHQLTVVLHDSAGVDPAAVNSLEASGVTIITSRVLRVTSEGDGPLLVELEGGNSLPADAVLTGSRFHPRTECLRGLGLALVAHPSGLGEVVPVDSTGRTPVKGLFAAGNLIDPGQQVIQAAANGAWVGSQVAFDLAMEDVAAQARPSGVEHEWDARYGERAPVWSANPNGTLVAEVEALDTGRALDVGAGEGADALWLAEQGWQVTATDVSGNALARVRSEADRRGLDVQTLRTDANDINPYSDAVFDLVSLQYGSFHRTPDQRGLRSLLDAVAVGGTLLVVAHAGTHARQSTDPGQQTWMYDPGAFVGIDAILETIQDSAQWDIDVNETRPRPLGAASGQHLEDTVLRATRVAPHVS